MEVRHWVDGDKSGDPLDLPLWGEFDLRENLNRVGLLGCLMNDK